MPNNNLNKYHFYLNILFKSIILHLRHLTENGYLTTIARGSEFTKTMKTLQSKGKDLKKQGKGNKRKAANDITDEEVDLLFQSCGFTIQHTLAYVVAPWSTGYNYLSLKLLSFSNHNDPSQFEDDSTFFSIYLSICT